jgi:hypothetical protein
VLPEVCAGRIVSCGHRSAHGGTPAAPIKVVRTYLDKVRMQRPGGQKKPPKGQEVFNVSGARTSLTDDVKLRTRKYAISMAVRTACFLGAIVTEGPLRWILFVGAIVLPYVAVVVANGGREPTRDAPPPVQLPLRTQLPPVQREKGS